MKYSSQIKLERDFMQRDDFEHFCKILTSFEESRQEAFEIAWSEGDVSMMVKLCEEHAYSDE